MKVNELSFRVTVDENNLPEKIEWNAGSGQQSACKSMMVALWDGKENNTLRMDLWTKDMSVEEMKKFFHQNIVTLTDTYLRATGDEVVAAKVKKIFGELGREMNVFK
jgi:gliding motility-associated protein GldC